MIKKTKERNDNNYDNNSFIQFGQDYCKNIRTKKSKSKPSWKRLDDETKTGKYSCKTLTKRKDGTNKKQTEKKKIKKKTTNQ